MDYDEAIIGRIRQRLRQAPAASVASLTPDGALPVPFFGDVFASRAATVGLNPGGLVHPGPHCLTETLVSLEAQGRKGLSDAQCDVAIQRLRTYFRQPRARDVWFSHLQRVLEGMGFKGYWDPAANHAEGDAVHLDLVQEPTTRKWSELAKAEQNAFLTTDLPFLKWAIRTFPFVVVLCDGPTALDHVRGLLTGIEIGRGTIETPSIIFGWDVLSASVGDRTIAIAGWSPPLNRPTGLTREDETALGCRIAETLRAEGLSL